MSKTKLHSLAIWARDLIASSSVIAGFLTPILFVVFTGLWSIWGDDIKATITEDVKVEISELQSDVLSNRTLLKGISESLDKLNRPTKIVEYSRASKFLEPCYVGEECVLQVVARRYAETVECRLIPNLTERVITSYIDYIPRRGISSGIGRSRTVNLPTAFSQLEIDVDIPDSIPTGPAEFRITTFYKCPWQLPNDSPINQESMAFTLNISERN